MRASNNFSASPLQPQLHQSNSLNLWYRKQGEVTSSRPLGLDFSGSREMHDLDMRKGFGQVGIQTPRDILVPFSIHVLTVNDSRGDKDGLAAELVTNGPLSGAQCASPHWEDHVNRVPFNPLMIECDSLLVDERDLSPLENRFIRLFGGMSLKSRTCWTPLEL